MRTRKAHKPALILSKRDEAILRAVHFYRYMTALDVTHLFFALSSLDHVRAILARLAGQSDFTSNQYLYRFRLPSAAPNSERVYTLGSRGRDYLARELGMPVEWYFRPAKTKYMGYSQLIHNLVLTRFLVAAHLWCKNRPEFRLANVRISYELARTPMAVKVPGRAKGTTTPVIPDAWLLFERVQDGKVARSYAVLLEIDRGTAYQQKFKEHIGARVEYVASGAYQQVFGVPGVIIAYATTGATPEYRETRRKTMCAWTREILAALHMAEWASIFRFHSLSLEEICTAKVFEEPVWYRPDSESPTTLFG